MTTIKNEYLEKVEKLIADTRRRLDAERTAGQDKIDGLAAQIDALKAELVPLPGQAKALRNQGLVKRANEVLEEVESLNIQIATLEVERARLEADRLAGFEGAFRAIFPEVNQLVRESILAGEEEKRRIDQERIIALNLAHHPDVYERQYSQEATQAWHRLEEAQDRLQTAIQANQVPAA